MRLRVLEMPVPNLPPELDGLRIAHLSDFHLGVPSRGLRAVRRAVDWTARASRISSASPVTCVSRASGQAELDRLLALIPDAYVVLGNHDFAISRDPFSQPVEIVDLTHGTLLSDSVVELSVRGHSVELAGLDPRTWLGRRQVSFPDSHADLRILLTHFPASLYRVEEGRFHFALAGHLHGGQIVLPYGFGRLLLAHPRVRHAQGLFVRKGTLLHVSPGLGTTFVPIRFFARPEATELVLRSV